jgi:hypothetical protein
VRLAARCSGAQRLDGCGGPRRPRKERRPEWIAATLRVFSKRVASFGVEIKPRLTNGHKGAAVAVGSGDDGPN